MGRRNNIDRSLVERRGLLDLLEGLGRENITVGEMEEIGRKLHKAGKRALNPLVRRLWKEKSGSLISRYAYLLDFFGDEVCLDELIRIVLRRRDDMEEEGKSALLSALAAHGVDVSAPPFDRLLKEAGGPLPVTLPKILDRGEPGVAWFLENFVNYGEEARIALVREMPRVAHPGVVGLLEMLCAFDEGSVAVEAVSALGKVRRPEAAGILSAVIQHGETALRAAAARSLRRLSFLQVAPAVEPLPPFVGAWASPFDGSGARTLAIGRRSAPGGIDLLLLRIENGGIGDAVSYGSLADDDHAAIISELTEEESVVEVEVWYFMLLLRDALFEMRENGALLPTEFFLRRGMFRDQDIQPARYLPQFPGISVKRLLTDASFTMQTAGLLEEENVGEWFVSVPAAYDLAEKWVQLREAGEENSREARRLVERFCTEIVEPEREKICRRLILTADLLQRIRAPRGVVEKVAACAESVESRILPSHMHPFLRRIAVESLELAAEALAEGYDLRKEFEDDDDE